MPLVKEKGNVRPRGFFCVLRDRAGDVFPPEASQSLRSGRPCAEVPVRRTPLNEGKPRQTALIVLGAVMFLVVFPLCVWGGRYAERGVRKG